MRISLFSLFLLCAAPAVCQTPAPASGLLGPSAPVSQGQGQLTDGLNLSSPQAGFQTKLPTALLAQISPGSPFGKDGTAGPIPTQWPNAKAELIPTQWPNLRLELIAPSTRKPEARPSPIEAIPGK